MIIVEGEKDVESLKTFGLVSSCNPQGAGQWHSYYTEYFRGKKIAIIPDNDLSGKKHSSHIATSLKGIAESVKVVAFPNLPDKGDVTDWIKAGGTKEQLLDIIRSAPEWAPVAEDLPGIIRLETVKSEKVEWLWNGYIPLGKVTLLDGDPGNGKSLFTVDLIARCTSSGIMPDGSKGITGGAVILVMFFTSYC